MALKWSDLFTQGTLINFSEHMWRARLQLKAGDLGIQESDEVKKALSFGTQRLAPKEAFEVLNRISTAWKSDINFHSLNFPLLEGVRFVPDNQVQILSGKLEIHQKAFQKEVRAFVNRYDEIKKKQLPILEQALKDACKTPEAAYAAYMRVESEYPSADAVSQKFGLEWGFFSVELPTSKEAAMAAKDAAPQIKSVVESMVSQLRSDLKSKVESLIQIAGRIDTDKKDGFTDRSIGAAMTVLDRVDALNILDDVDLRQQTRKLRAALDSSAKGTVELKEVVGDLMDARKALEIDKEKAIKEAEKKLMGIGDRKMKWK